MPQPSDILQFIRRSAVLVWRAEESGSVEELPEWTALTGQSAEQLAGEGWMNAVHPDDVERVRMAWKTAVLHGSEYNTDYRVKHADGAYRWVNSRGIPILNSEGAVSYWVGAVFAIAPGLRHSIKPPSTVRERKSFTDITPAALRMARGALNISAAALARDAGISVSSIRRLEEDARNAASFRAGTIESVLKALASYQLKFIGEEGVVTGIDASRVVT